MMGAAESSIKSDSGEAGNRTCDTCTYPLHLGGIWCLVDFNTSTKIANYECHAEGILIIVFTKDLAIEKKMFLNRNGVFQKVVSHNV